MLSYSTSTTGITIGYMTVKDVIAKYQRGEIGYAVPDQEPQLAFDFVTERHVAISDNFFRMIANKCHLYLYQSAAENFQI
jgi:hypothetical protein